MATTVDHLVWAGPDLEALISHAASLGLQPVDGGQHVGRGTRNALVGLGAGCYLELLGPDASQPEPDRPRPFGVDDLYEPRLITWAVHAPDLDATVAAARAAGYDPGDGEPMSRARPDGVLLEWRLTPPGGVDGDLRSLAPFLIDWQDSPHPSADLPPARLAGLLLESPADGQLRHTLEALDVSAPVSVTPADSSRIIATIVVGADEITLS